ncbi:MAG TPA: leucine-rich repeat domain-containing protein [Polyangiaceae bacterium]|nr:leucine-rich repeat domain-containing protein [Polyangiaceae bacterium]
MVPNRDRHAYRIGDVPAGSPEITIATIGKGEANWSRITSLPNLEELTLHEPTKEQLAALGELRSIKRLRISHARLKSIDLIRALGHVEELILEYVSGFEDLSPLQSLTRLRALHLENLRRVGDFSGLAGLTRLQYLSIHGTLDWNQPIANFEFLRGLPLLEVLSLWWFSNKTPYPALLPALALKHLKKLHLGARSLAAREYALLEEGLAGIAGATWGPYEVVTHAWLPVPRNDVRAHLPKETLEAKHPEVVITFDGRREIPDPASQWCEFTGKGAGKVKCTSSTAEAKCRAYAEAYAAMKLTARALIPGRGAE